MWSDELYEADRRCKECLKFVHSIHPALVAHVTKNDLPPGYWLHAIDRVCPEDTYCGRTFGRPHGAEIAYGLEDLHEGADGDAQDPAISSPSRLFGLVCGPQASITRSCPARAAADARSAAKASVGLRRDL